MSTTYGAAAASPRDADSNEAVHDDAAGSTPATAASASAGSATGSAAAGSLKRERGSGKPKCVSPPAQRSRLADGA